VLPLVQVRLQPVPELALLLPPYSRKLTMQLPTEQEQESSVSFQNNSIKTSKIRTKLVPPKRRICEKVILSRFQNKGRISLAGPPEYSWRIGRIDVYFAQF
jgi:hypothetical protein